jgi:RNA polymerase sigma-70 factor (ECF subfamily)
MVIVTLHAPLQPEPPDFDQWLAEARAGSGVALGRLFDACRPFLQLVASERLPADLQAKLGASDIVQETFLNARKGFGTFHGKTEDELLAWLRQILINELATKNRAFRGTSKRQVSKEVGQPDALQGNLAEQLPGEDASPSEVVVATENREELQRALAKLSTTDQQVIQWRNYELQSFDDIGKKLGRSAEAARKVWARAIEQLQRLMAPDDRSV